MLLEIAIELAQLQVVDGKEHPESKMLGLFHCIFCNHLLHGHGWRKRYFIDQSLSSMQVWLHRKFCPCCGKTFTLLPSWVHAFKLFSLETICLLLGYKLQKGHFNTVLGVSGYLQRTWWRSYSHRSRVDTDFPDHGKVFHMLRARLRGCISSPPSVIIVQERHPSLMGIHLQRPAHQRLYLYVPRGIP